MLLPKGQLYFLQLERILCLVAREVNNNSNNKSNHSNSFNSNKINLNCLVKII